MARFVALKLPPCQFALGKHHCTDHATDALYALDGRHVGNFCPRHANTMLDREKDKERRLGLSASL